jgi:hypothetical protein
MNVKSERLKKLENELQDLQQWLKLGLVPKKDMEKHKEEIVGLQSKIDEEKERLRFLKESGELEEYTAPKRHAHARPAFQEPQTLPEMDVGDEGFTEAGLDMETESFDLETATEEGPTEEGGATTEEEGVVEEEEEEEEDPFSDRNRWRRGILEDPDANDW